LLGLAEIKIALPDFRADFSSQPLNFSTSQLLPQLSVFRFQFFLNPSTPQLLPQLSDFSFHRLPFPLSTTQRLNRSTSFSV